MQMVRGNGGNQFRQYAGQNVRNQNGYNAVQNVKNQNLNRNGNVVAARAKGNVTRNNGHIPPKTAEQKLARKTKLKAKSTVMLAIPDEHILKFHVGKDEKSLWEAIKNRFGGNKESKKIQKTILKKRYENFVASRSKGLDKTYDSLPSAWNTHTLIMRNKDDLDTLSMDDLYNNLKVYEAEIKSQSSSSLNSHNVAFVSSENTSSTNEAVNTAHDDSDSHMEEIDLPFTRDDPMPPSIKDDDYDSGRDILILEELLDNYSLSLPANESYHFDIPSPYRPPVKPPDGKTRTLNIKMIGDVSD
nr:ribonuclease H-like domain-containing protein [Tanacetum cinerariifolium]